MPKQLSPEEKKARRAEINRQNAKKSTGPKTPAGKAISRLNGLTNGSRTVVIDIGHAPGLALLSCEDSTEYQEMVAEYMRTLAPQNRVEVGIVQRIIDTQWRLLRNSRLQTLEMEAALDEARKTEDADLPPAVANEMNVVVANHVCADSKYLLRLQREEAALMRLIHSSHRELQSVRKLNPSPAPPVRPRLECTGEKQSVLERAYAQSETSPEPQVVANKKESVATANDRSQPVTGWNFTFRPPAPPKTVAAGHSGGTYAGMELV
jgi:hypothetical protein